MLSQRAPSHRAQSENRLFPSYFASDDYQRTAAAIRRGPSSTVKVRPTVRCRYLLLTATCLAGTIWAGGCGHPPMRTAADKAANKQTAEYRPTPARKIKGDTQLAALPESAKQAESSVTVN